MKRRLLIVAVFLLAGAVVNVALAWGFVTWTVIALNSRANPQFSYTGTLAVGWPTEAFGYTWTSNEFPAYSSLRPIWPGVAVNTLFYAVVLWLLSGGPFRLRRWVRVRRGLCPKCAYPRGESAVCTECGKLLSKRAMVAT